MFPKLFDEETSEGGEAFKVCWLIKTNSWSTTQQLHIFDMFYAKLLTGLNSGEST